MDKEQNRYIAIGDLDHKADIERLKTQEDLQNLQTALFLEKNLPKREFENIMVLYAGSGSVLDVLTPYLQKEGHIVINDAAPVKVLTSVERAQSLGVQNSVSFTGKALEVLQNMPDNSFDGIVQIRLGLIWDPDYQNTINHLARVMTPESLVLFEDLNVSTMNIKPESTSFNILKEKLIDLRTANRLENEMGTKLGKVSENSGLRVLSESSYQTVTKSDQPYHRSVYEFFVMAKNGIVGSGRMTGENFDEHMSVYAEELDNQNAEMFYPEITQVLAQKS